MKLRTINRMLDDVITRKVDNRFEIRICGYKYVIDKNNIEKEIKDPIIVLIKSKVQDIEKVDVYNVYGTLHVSINNKIVFTVPLSRLKRIINGHDIRRLFREILFNIFTNKDVNKKMTLKFGEDKKINVIIKRLERNKYSINVNEKNYTLSKNNIDNMIMKEILDTIFEYNVNIAVDHANKRLKVYYKGFEIHTINIDLNFDAFEEFVKGFVNIIKEYATVKDKMKEIDEKLSKEVKIIEIWR